VSEEGGGEGGEADHDFPGNSRHLLVIADGLAEPPSDDSTLVRAETPVLDRMCGSGFLCRIDPQDAMPAERTTSERGIARLLGGDDTGSGSLQRASLLSLLPGGDEKGDGSACWFFLATPVLFDRERRLVRYVNDRDREHAFWTDLLDRFPKDPSCRLRPVRKADGRIDRMLLALSCPPSPDRCEGSPPRLGLSESSSGFSPAFSDLLRRTPGFEDFAQEGAPEGSRKKPEREINGLWLWGGGRSLVSGRGARDKWELQTTGGRWLVGDTLLVRALGLWFGYRSVPLLNSTGDVDTDLGEKMAEVLRRIREGASRIVLHLEGFDMASHRRDSPGKIRFLERVDREVFGLLEKWLEAGLLTSVRITSDHQSSPVSGNHESGPVPALFVHRNGSEGFGGLTGRGVSTPSVFRMTEKDSLSCPLVPVAEWNGWLDRYAKERGNLNGGKDLCLALS
jgi:2,3-bisphosphoglycerate-independent phosphoglycerate mutase